jgi:plastocyanin
VAAARPLDVSENEQYLARRTQEPLGYDVDDEDAADRLSGWLQHRVPVDSRKGGMDFQKIHAVGITAATVDAATAAAANARYAAATPPLSIPTASHSDTEILVSFSATVTTTLTWTVRTYEPIAVNVGDTLVFEWPAGSTHDVYELPAGQTTCPSDFSVATQLGTTTASPVSVSLSQPGTRTFACGVGTHCASGQMVTVTVGSPSLEQSSSARSRVAPGLGLMVAAVLGGATWASGI